MGSFEHLRCLTATLHTTQQKNQRVFWGCDQNPFDATIVTIDGLNSFMLVFLDLMTQDLFSALMSLFFSLIRAHLQQVGNLTSLVQRRAQYGFQPFGLSTQTLQGSPLYTVASTLSFYIQPPLDFPDSLLRAPAFTHAL